MPDSVTVDTRLSNPLARIRADVRAMHAYVVQEADGLVKLDAMENPYRLSLALQAELGARLGAVEINRYPGARVADLRTALRAQAQPPEGWQLILGNGSDELISLLAMACARPGATVLAPEPSFVMYHLSAQFHGLAFHPVALRRDFELDAAVMLAAIERHDPSLVFLSYPNNPSGTLWRKADMQRIIDAQRERGGLVVIDEAYQPFAQHSWIQEVRAAPARHEHVLIMRTLSKFGLAGARVGYLMGAEGIVSEVDKLRPPYNVSLLDAECALFALEHAAVFERQAGAIRTERERLLAELAALPGVAQVFPSQANMLLVRVADATGTFERLKKQGVLVKNVSRMHPLLAQCLRLTVGTPEENTRLLAALRSSS